MCQWRGYSFESVQEFACRKGFDDREMSDQVQGKRVRKLCLSQRDENETRRNIY